MIGDEVRITVTSAGCERFEGERQPASLGVREEERALGGDEAAGDLGLGDDDFDVPDFLR